MPRKGEHNFISYPQGFKYTPAEKFFSSFSFQTWEMQYSHVHTGQFCGAGIERILYMFKAGFGSGKIGAESVCTVTYILKF